MNFTKFLGLVNVELKAREACVVSSHITAEGKNDFGFSSPSHSPYMGSSLVSGTSSVHRENMKFKKGGSKRHSLEASGRKCFSFCTENHWSDKCRVVSDVQARKDFLKNGNPCFICLKINHISRNYQKTKPCFYCKKLHNSAIYS